MKEVESRGASVVGFSSYERGEKYLDTVVNVLELGLLEPLVANAGRRLFAYYVADGMGRAIDKPRNVAKSLTVE